MAFTMRIEKSIFFFLLPSPNPKPERNGRRTQKSFHISFFMRVFSFRFPLSPRSKRVSNCLCLAPFTSPQTLYVFTYLITDQRSNGHTFDSDVECACVLRRGNTQQLILVSMLYGRSYLMASTQIQFYSLCIAVIFGCCDWLLRKWKMLSDSDLAIKSEISPSHGHGNGSQFVHRMNFECPSVVSVWEQWASFVAEEIPPSTQVFITLRPQTLIKWSEYCGKATLENNYINIALNCGRKSWKSPSASCNTPLIISFLLRTCVSRLHAFESSFICLFLLVPAHFKT